MALKLSGHLFTGPFPIETTEIRSNQAPVVYAIIAKGGEPWAPTFRVIDIGFSEDAGVRFSDLPERARWREQGGGQLGVYLFYAPRSEYSLEQRRSMAQRLRQAHDPPNGFAEA
jgi:hypothetical protein